MSDTERIQNPPLRTIGALLIFLAGTLLLLSIYSYSPEDRGFSYSGSSLDIQNWVGASGAYISDLLRYFLGLSAYFVPMGLFASAFRIFEERSIETAPVTYLTRVMGVISVVMSTCLLFSVYGDESGFFSNGKGGVVGLELARYGIGLFGEIGLTVIAGGFLIAGVLGIGLPLKKGAQLVYRVMNGVTLVFKGGARRLGAFATHWFENRKNERDRNRLKLEHRQNALKKIEKSAEGRVELEILPKVPEPHPSSKSSQRRLFDTKSIKELPDVELLDAQPVISQSGYSEQTLEALSRQLELKLADFAVEASVVSVLPGPVVTRFEVQPAAGVKVQKISALAKDLARSLAVLSVRIVEVIPGKSVVGIEIPNETREMVQLKEVIHSPVFQEAPSHLTLALGKDISGMAVTADLARMPHLLVAGTTGSGKSVGVNAMLLSLLLKSTPEQVKMILVDPKMLELSAYEGIPHLLTPVVTDMKEAAQALNWCVAEMERRYKLMASMGVRNLAGFNKQIRDAESKGETVVDPSFEGEESDAVILTELPAIVVVIDEFADMMMVVGKKVEQLIARIAQKARAAGIHLILATQRPSVDVITGLIKANIPSRIGFQVSSKVDSRTILDQGGAEQLLGYGDMLYLPPGTALPQRVHGAFVSDEEVHRVVGDWKERGEPDYISEIVDGLTDEDPFLKLDGDDDTEVDDALYDEAVQFVLESRRASISSVQRKLRIGYNRAARLIEAMELAGVVSPMNSNGSREIMVPKRD